jgi:hypothetical protein
MSGLSSALLLTLILLLLFAVSVANVSALHAASIFTVEVSPDRLKVFEERSYEDNV